MPEDTNEYGAQVMPLEAIGPGDKATKLEANKQPLSDTYMDRKRKSTRTFNTKGMF